jgi:hypothetical protein
VSDVKENNRYLIMQWVNGLQWCFSPNQFAVVADLCVPWWRGYEGWHQLIGLNVNKFNSTQF